MHEIVFMEMGVILWHTSHRQTIITVLVIVINNNHHHQCWRRNGILWTRRERISSNSDSVELICRHTKVQRTKVGHRLITTLSNTSLVGVWIIRWGTR